MVTHKHFLLVVVGLGLGGCTPIPRGFDSPEPAARIDAALEAADRGDRSAIPDLIGLLDSDDPATRMVGIRSLERLTGRTQGYDHAGPIAERDRAVDRWVEWYREAADDSAANDEAASAAVEPLNGQHPDG